MHRPHLLIVALFTIGLGACGSDTPASSTGNLQVATSPLGSIVTDSRGRPLYMFVDDANGMSACNDECANDWPPYITTSKATFTVASGIDATKLGFIVRTDGTTQVTLAGSPLYFWSGDEVAGDLRGQGIGGDWFVLSPAGVALHGSVPPPAWSGAQTSFTVTTATSSKGTIAADFEGAPLYMFVDDVPGLSSACNDDCANDWPPYLKAGNGALTAEDGVGLSDDKVGTITREDGTTQITYNGHPLYSWPGDWNPGDLRGQGIGGDWFVLDATGTPVH